MQHPIKNPPSGHEGSTSAKAVHNFPDSTTSNSIHTPPYFQYGLSNPLGAPQPASQQPRLGTARAISPVTTHNQPSNPLQCKEMLVDIFTDFRLDYSFDFALFSGCNKIFLWKIYTFWRRNLKTMVNRLHFGGC